MAFPDLAIVVGLKVAVVLCLLRALLVKFKTALDSRNAFKSLNNDIAKSKRSKIFRLLRPAACWEAKVGQHICC